MRPSILLLAPALVVLATASDALAHGSAAPAAPHSAPAGAHVGHAIAALADLGEAVIDAAQSVPGERGKVADDRGNPEAEWTYADEPTPPAAAAPESEPVPIPVHLPPSAADRPVAQPVKFDLGGAYGAIAGVDVGACKAQGLTTGYGKVILEFGPDGRPAREHIEVPAGSTPAAGACVDQAYRAVQVARFDGAPVYVRRAFFVAG